MSEFFKSALGLFGNQSNNSNPTLSMPGPAGSNQNSSHQTNEFVGQNIMVGTMRLRIMKLLAEGGYAIVYIAQDVSNANEYALKRIFSADEASNQAIKQEIDYLKKLSNHENLIKFISAACEDNNSRSKEYLILTELCKEPLIDHLRAGLSLPSGSAFNFEHVLQIFYQICRSVQFLHAQEPPIIHRDLKLENFLISMKYEIKLCDFGSATSIVYEPDNSWSVNQRSLIEDEIAKQTTPMYRAPEMIDLYNNYRIDTQSDIWALGCVLFVLCFNKHPFEDGAKLRIINGKFQIPTADKEFQDFHDLIRLMLNTDPSKRPDINEIIYHLENIAETRSINFVKNLNFLKKTENLLNNSTPQTTIQHVNNQAQTSASNQQNWMGNASSLLKGGSSFLKTIKDASSKVMDTVHNSINRTDVDLTYITSRLIVMSCPTEGIESAGFGNNIDLIKETIESKHSRNYRIYNLANKVYRKEKFYSQVIDLGMQLNTTRAPPISLMCKLCVNVNKFLNENDKNVCIINCNDGKVISAIAVCSLLMYFKVIKNPNSCLNLFNSKRGQIQLTPIQYKFLLNTHKLFNSQIKTSVNECLLLNVSLVGVPLFNRARNGCTPYIEVYNKDKKIYTNLQDYDHLKKYTQKDGLIQLPVNCHKFYGDVTVMVFHAKSLLGTEKVMSTKICQFQFHTSLAVNDLNQNSQLKFNKNELDCLDTLDKYPNDFHVLVDLNYKNIESPQASDDPWNNLQEFNSQLFKTNQNTLFSNFDEMNQIIQIYDVTPKIYSDENNQKSPNIQVENHFEEEKKIPNIPSDDEGYNYLSPNGRGDYSASSASSRSASPIVSRQQQQSEEVKVGNLLDFDDLGSETTQEQIRNQTETKLTNDLELLLDIDGSSPQVEPMQNKNQKNLFDDFLQNEEPVTKKTNDLLNFDFPSFTSNQANISQTSKQNIPNNLMFDPFGKLDVQNNFITNKPLNTNQNFIRNNSSNASLGSASFKPNDPFADLNAFNSSSSQSIKQNNSSSRLSSQTPTFSQQIPSPTQEFNFNTSNKPNYFSNAFSSSNSNIKPNTSQPSTNPKSTNIFDDFLPENFVKNQNRQNMTIKDLKKEQNVKEMDPDKLKIMEWTDGKKANIRALLCSMHKVLWEGESKWEPIGMNQLVSANDVKKIYRKACLVVHPDKLSDHPQVNLARMIFVELNEAWAKFQQEGQQNLF